MHQWDHAQGSAAIRERFRSQWRKWKQCWRYQSLILVRDWQLGYFEKQRQWNVENYHVFVTCNQKDGSFALLWNHFDKMEMQTNTARCNMCEKKTKWICMIYIKYCCVLSKKAWNEVSCCRKFHDQDYYGLARCDFKIHGILCQNWKPPTEMPTKQNNKLIANLPKQIKEGDDE